MYMYANSQDFEWFSTLANYRTETISTRYIVEELATCQATNAHTPAVLGFVFILRHGSHGQLLMSNIVIIITTGLLKTETL